MMNDKKLISISPFVIIANIVAVSIVFYSFQVSNGLLETILTITSLWPAWILCFVFIIIGALEETIKNKRIQNERNTLAENIKNFAEDNSHVNKLKENSYILLLRSFAFEKLLEVQNPDKQYYTFSQMADTISLEIFIGDALTGHSTIAVVDESRFIYKHGVGKVKLDDHIPWQETVLKFIEKSKLNIIIPGYTEGVIWELNQIQKLNLWHKTIIISPPISHPAIERRWHKTCEMLIKKFKINLDADTGLGAVFIIINGKAITVQTNLYQSTHDSFKETIEKVISGETYNSLSRILKLQELKQNANKDNMIEKQKSSLQQKLLLATMTAISTGISVYILFG
ncbi:MAG: hypothetical protein AB2554_04420 [Candidatus Thiodiazotropha sp.]